MKDTLLKRLDAQQDAFSYLLYGLTEQQLRSRPMTDKWSVFENIAHLGRYQEIVLQRMQLIVHSDQPLFERYKAEDDEGFYVWVNKTYQFVMDDFEKGRKELNSYLAALTDEQISKTGKHPVCGVMNITGWTEMFLLHEAHHLFTILKLTAMLRNGGLIGLY